VKFRFLLAALAVAPCCAHAHTTRLSGAQITVSGHEAEVALILNGADLDVALKTTLADAGGRVSEARLQKSRDAIIDYATARARISNSAGGTCFPARRALAGEAEHVKLTVLWTCPPMTGALIYHSTLFNEIDPAARQMVTVKGDASGLALLSAASPRVTLAPTEAGFGDVFLHYLVAGVEHIAIGYDHIAFLLAVIVLGRRFWPLFAAVTAFTVAHSITLTLAVLGWVELPGRIVEPLIAATIVYVAAENFFIRDIRHRWWLTLVFGLVHGFGFASVLREYGIPDHALVPALAAFNVGVEAGQILIVAIAVLAWRAGFALSGKAGVRGDASLQRRVSLVVSAGVLLLGFYWLGERLLA
jgi:hypothetical protein